MKAERLNAYRLNWVFCSFDLPTNTKEERKKAAEFRSLLIENGFFMFQYSVYGRPCASKEHADTVIQSIYSKIPYKGNVVLFRITDKQFGNIIMITRNASLKNKSWKQLEIF